MVTGSEMKMTSGVIEEAKCWSAVIVREFVIPLQFQKRTQIIYNFEYDREDHLSS